MFRSTAQLRLCGAALRLLCGFVANPCSAVFTTLTGRPIPTLLLPRPKACLLRDVAVGWTCMAPMRQEGWEGGEGEERGGRGGRGGREGREGKQGGREREREGGEGGREGGR